MPLFSWPPYCFGHDMPSQPRSRELAHEGALRRRVHRLRELLGVRVRHVGRGVLVEEGLELCRERHLFRRELELHVRLLLEFAAQVAHDRPADRGMLRAVLEGRRGHRRDRRDSVRRRQLEPSEKELAARVIVAALDDAGIAPSEVDGFASYTMETNDEVEIARNIGAGDVTFFSQVGYGGGAGPACVGHLAMAIATGQCRVGVAWRSRKRGSGGRPWAGAAQASTNALWTRPYGLLRPVDEVAMLTRRYMHEYGATRDHLANVALAVREHGEPQSARRDVREAAHARGLHGGALDLRAAVPLRQLPRDRRRAGLRAGVGRARARLREAARLRARLRPGPAGRSRTRW